MTHPLLAELKSTLIETLSEELHGAALVWGEASDLTDNVTRELDLGSKFLQRQRSFRTFCSHAGTALKLLMARARFVLFLRLNDAVARRDSEMRNPTD